jgi:hypothetical protein
MLAFAAAGRLNRIPCGQRRRTLDRQKSEQERRHQASQATNIERGRHSLCLWKWIARDARRPEKTAALGQEGGRSALLTRSVERNPIVRFRLDQRRRIAEDRNGDGLEGLNKRNSGSRGGDAGLRVIGAARVICDEVALRRHVHDAMMLAVAPAAEGQLQVRIGKERRTDQRETEKAQQQNRPSAPHGPILLFSAKAGQTTPAEPNARRGARLENRGARHGTA